MTLAEFAKGPEGGGQYLRASDLSNGLKASILGTPTTEKRDFGDGEKLVANFPMKVEGKDGEMIWSPGKNAVRYLFEVLGETDETKWKYPIAGHFEAKNVQFTDDKGKKTSKLAWLFEPDVKPAKAASAESSFTCGVCSKAFKTVVELQKHIGTH